MSGVEVVKRWYNREAFVDTKWGGHGRGRCLGTGKGSRDQRGVIVQDSASKGCGDRVVVNMASDVAHWIRGWVPQNDIAIASGGGELCWGSISLLMKIDVNVANWCEDKPRDRPIVVVLRFENNLIPESTELVLQFR